MIWSVSTLARGDRHRDRVAGARTAPCSAVPVSSARTSVRRPVTAAAAAIAGLIRCVRAPGPLAADEVAVRGRGAALAGRHRVAVGAEAHRAAGVAPLEAGLAGTRGPAPRPRPAPSPGPSPGTTQASTLGGDLAGRATTAAALRRSSMRPLVHEPMKTRSTAHVGQRRAGRRGPCRRARAASPRAARRPAAAAGSGTRPVIGSASSGLLPQVTIGAIASASSATSRSNAASGVGWQRAPARQRAASQAAPCGA